MNNGHDGLNLEPFDPAPRQGTYSVPPDRRETTVNVIARQRELDDLRRRQSRLTALVALLLLALAGLGVYGYFTLNKLDVPLSQFPTLQEGVAAMDQRLSAAEQHLAEWSPNWEKLGARVSAVEAGLRHNLALAHQDAQELTAQLHQRVQAEMDERWQPMEARVARLESDREQDRAQMAQMQQQVAALRTDTGRDLAVLNDSTTRTEQDVRQLAQQVKRERVDFEVAEDSTRELAPGITLRVTDTDVRYQRVKGWLWLLPDRRTIWVRGLGAQQALVFHVQGNETPHELVITRVSRDAVAGYLLLPASAEPATVGSTPPANRPGASN